MPSHTHTLISESKSALGVVPELKQNLALAQFLHDNVSSNLAVMKMQVYNLSNHTKSRSQKRGLKLIGELVDQLVESIRQVSSGLRAEQVQASSLYKSIEHCVHKFQVRTLIRIVLTTSGNEPDISPEVSATVMAILQEALANIVRHAQASRVHVHTAQQKGFLTLSVRDNGTGIRRSFRKNGNGFGLFSMRQRVAECGGAVLFRSEPGRGFEVYVRIPLRDQDEITEREPQFGISQIPRDNWKRIRDDIARLTSDIDQLAYATMSRKETAARELMTDRRRNRTDLKLISAAGN